MRAGPSNQCVTHRVGQGSYRVYGPAAAGGRFVDVKYFDHLKGWIAAATWDRHLYSDPLPTKRAAVATAAGMLDGAA